MIQSLFWLAIHFNNNNEFFGIIFTFASVISIFLFFTLSGLNKDFYDTLAKYYVSFMIILGVLANISIFGYYAGLFEQSILFQAGDINYYRIGFTVCNTVLNKDIYGAVRPSGIYNEPGQFGIHLLFALYIQNFLQKAVKKETILIISIIITFSTGALIGLFIYLFFKPKSIIILLSSGTFIVIIFLIFPHRVKYLK